MKTRLLIVLTLLALAFSVQAAEPAAVVGRIDRIDAAHVVVDGIEYPLSGARTDTPDDSGTTCYDATLPGDPRELHLSNLMGVGYAERARIFLQNGVVTRIDILEMRQ